MADEGNTLFSEGVDDVQQVFCGASQTADTLNVERIALTHIVKHSPELWTVFIKLQSILRAHRNLLGEDAACLIVSHDLLLSRCLPMLCGYSDVAYFAHGCCFLSDVKIFFFLLIND